MTLWEFADVHPFIFLASLIILGWSVVATTETIANRKRL